MFSHRCHEKGFRRSPSPLARTQPTPAHPSHVHAAHRTMGKGYKGKNPAKGGKGGRDGGGAPEGGLKKKWSKNDPVDSDSDSYSDDRCVRWRGGDGGGYGTAKIAPDPRRDPPELLRRVRERLRVRVGRRRRRPASEPARAPEGCETRRAPRGEEPEGARGGHGETAYCPRAAREGSGGKNSQGGVRPVPSPRRARWPPREEGLMCVRA